MPIIKPTKLGLHNLLLASIAIEPEYETTNIEK